jgi:VWFA-related protein
VLASRLALAAVLAGAPPAGQSPPVFSSQVEAVRVDVAVMRGEAPVLELAAADFELREDGVPQALSLVREEKDVPLEATLLLDLSASVIGERLAALRQAGLAFLGGLAAEDEASLLCFSHRVSLVQPLTKDLDGLRAALLSLQGGGSTALRDALAAALLSRAPTRRRAAVVVFSDGADNMSWLSAPAVEEIARRGDAVIYAVLTGSSEPSAGVNRPFLSSLADATGGRVFDARRDSDLRDTFLVLLHHLRGRYLLTYTPVSARPGWHRLDLRLKHGKGRVLARPGYWRESGSP